MEQTLTMLLPGMVIYMILSIASQFVVTRLWKASQVLAQFFRDSADGRRLAREAEHPPNFSDIDEHRLYARIVRSVTIVTWLRYLPIGTALVLSVAISYALFRQNCEILMTASDRRKY